MKKSAFILIAVLIVIMMGCAAKIPSPQNDGTQGTSTLDTQLNVLVQQIIDNLAQQKKTRLAVIEFTDLEGRATTFGKFVAEELTTRLFAANRFQIVERQLMNKVLSEQSLGMTGIIDQTTVQRMGSVLGVEAIATGSVAETVAEMGAAIKINARIIATDTGSVFAAAAVSIPRDTHMGTNTGWVQVGTGDCSGRDIGLTDGFTPDDRYVIAGYTAVCWDGSKYINKNFPGKAACTYKNISPEQCTGGSNPGKMYRGGDRP